MYRYDGVRPQVEGLAIAHSAGIIITGLWEMKKLSHQGWGQWLQMADRVATGQGNFIFSSRSGKSQGILQIGQRNFKYQESRGKSQGIS